MDTCTLVTYSVHRFQPFVDFLITFGSRLLDRPFNGNLVFIHELFKRHQLNSKLEFLDLDLQLFLLYLGQFHEICECILEFDRKPLGPKSRLTWIDLSSILILKDRLSGKKASSIRFKHGRKKAFENSSKELLSILNGTLFSEVEVDSTLDISFRTDYAALDRLLRQPTARSRLALEKIRLRDQQELFAEVCNVAKHNQILSSLCINKADYSGNNKQGLPELKKVHDRLVGAKKMMLPEVYECSQSKIHFIPIVNHHTDSSLGECSYLDTCHKMKSCRYLHYYTLQPLVGESKPNPELQEKYIGHEYTIGDCFTEYQRKVLPPQWINCDIRYLPFLILGKFAVIISDPAWDIHMALPYGTCKDGELLGLSIDQLQDEGVIFLWVTGRSIDIGRKALVKWGYKICNEMVWVKLNQLKRTIVTGRTGHWLNHSKEHLLVGLKGNPIWLNRRLDMDVVVSATRETLRKPDEIYDIAERMVGVHARKLEIFGRDHNTRPGWFTIGNQLQGDSICEASVRHKYDEYLKTKHNK